MSGQSRGAVECGYYLAGGGRRGPAVQLLVLAAEIRRRGADQFGVERERGIETADAMVGEDPEVAPEQPAHSLQRRQQAPCMRARGQPLAASWRKRREIGSASCRARESQSVYISVAAVSVKTNTHSNYL